MECGVSAVSAQSDRIGNAGSHVGAHAGNQDDAPSALRNHVARGLARSEERPMDVDIIQTLYPVEGVARSERGEREEHQYRWDDRRATVTHSKAE